MVGAGDGKTGRRDTLTPIRRLAAILGGSAGNLVEWYDWFAYASFSIYFAKVFFPRGDQTDQLLPASMIFALGFWAPALLTLARLIQGFSLGGQYGVSATYLSEMAGRGHRGFWSSFQFVTLIGGQLIALAVLIVLQHA